MVNQQAIPRITVIGIGGGGTNAVNRMINEAKDYVRYYVANTDLQALNSSPCENKILLGPQTTRGMGAGSQPSVGRAAAVEVIDQIKEIAKDCDLVFLAAGMGGGTGTGAIPVFAKAFKELNVLTIAIVTRPFSFEGRNRLLHASEGLQELRATVDSLIIVSNDRLLKINGDEKLVSAFARADEVLKQSVSTISQLISEPALINLDFADVKNIMSSRGLALIGIGRGSGPNKAKEAAEMALNSMLVESSISGAGQTIIAITGGSDLTLYDANEAVEVVRNASSENVNVIFGVSINNIFKEEMFVTLIATDFSDDLKEETSEDDFGDSETLIPSFLSRAGRRS